MPSRGGHIQVKRVYDPADPSDGVRVLVDRIWPRGVTKERAAVALWLKDVAPSAALRTWFGHAPARWEEFKRRYRAELEQNTANVQQLRDLAAKSKVTLLFAAQDRSHNNAIVLRDYLAQRIGRDHTAPKAKPR
jgi:uncharacterized protein YeaO (DUF488 family)